MKRELCRGCFKVKDNCLRFRENLVDYPYDLMYWMCPDCIKEEEEKRHKTQKPLDESKGY